jgi:hypothetical protein
MTKTWTRWACVVIALIAGTMPALPAHCQSDKEKLQGDTSVLSNDAFTSLEKVDQRFRGIYASSREESLKNCGPIILVKDNQLIVLHDGKRAQFPFHVGDYDVLKTIDHVVLSLFLVLPKNMDTELDQKTLAALQNVKGMIKASRSALSGCHLPGKTLERQGAILDESDHFIDTIVETRYVNSLKWRRFADDLNPQLFANMNEAIAAELDSLDRQLTSAAKTLSRQDLDSLHVIVFGGHMARDQSALMQFFQTALGQKREGDRLIYCEGADNETQGLDLLATHILDASIGTGFFSDRWRMHRDLLCDGARRYLARHHIKALSERSGTPVAKR